MPGRTAPPSQWLAVAVSGIDAKRVDNSLWSSSRSAGLLKKEKDATTNNLREGVLEESRGLSMYFDPVSHILTTVIPITGPFAKSH